MIRYILCLMMVLFPVVGECSSMTNLGTGAYKSGQMCYTNKANTFTATNIYTGSNWFDNNKTVVGSPSTVYDTMTVNTNSSSGITINSLPTGVGIDSYVTLMLTLNNNATDTEFTPKTITNTSVTFSSTNYPFSGGGYSGYFSSATLTTVGTSDTAFGTGDFTIDFWMLSIQNSGNYDGIISNSANGTWNWRISNYFTSSVIGFNYNNGSTNVNLNTSTGANDGNWHWIVVQRRLGIFYIYKDGVNIGTYSSNTGDNVGTGSSYGFLLGNNPGNNSYLGYLSQVRVSKGIARYPITGSLTVPTTPYTAAISQPTLTLSGSGTTLSQIQSNSSNNTMSLINTGNIAENISSTGAVNLPVSLGLGTVTSPTSKVQTSGTCGAIGPVGSCWTSTGQLGYCSGAGNICTSCTAC